MIIKEESVSKNKYLSNRVNGLGSSVIKNHYSFGIANGMRYRLLDAIKEEYLYRNIYHMTNTDIEDGHGESNYRYTVNQKTQLY